MLDNSPLSLVLRSRSHCAAGIRKEIPIVSFSTLNSTKQMSTVSCTWTFPKPTKANLGRIYDKAIKSVNWMDKRTNFGSVYTNLKLILPICVTASSKVTALASSFAFGSWKLITEITGNALPLSWVPLLTSKLFLVILKACVHAWRSYTELMYSQQFSMFNQWQTW